MLDNVAQASEEREGLHPDRAPRRDDHPRDPHRDRDPLLPQLPGSREQERGRRRPASAIPSVEAYVADNRHVRRHDGRRTAGVVRPGVNPSIIFVQPAAGTSYCVQATAPDDATKQAFKSGTAGRRSRPAPARRNSLFLKGARSCRTRACEASRLPALAALVAASFVVRTAARLAALGAGALSRRVHLSVDRPVDRRVRPAADPRRLRALPGAAPADRHRAGVADRRRRHRVPARPGDRRARDVPCRRPGVPASPGGSA